MHSLSFPRSPLDEAAHFFRLPPDLVRLHAERGERPIVAGRGGDEYIALEDLLLIVEAITRQRARGS